MKKLFSRLPWFVLLTASVGAFLSLNVFAYIDPSVVTMGVQVAAGIIVAAGAVFFVWWRKVKKKVSDKLGIDENAGKEVEGDLVLTDESAADGAAVETAAVEAENPEADKQ